MLLCLAKGIFQLCFDHMMQLVYVQKQHIIKEVMLSNIFIFSWSLKKPRNCKGGKKVCK